MVKKVKGIILFVIKDTKEEYTVDLKKGSGKMTKGKEGKPDLTITVSDADFASMADGKLNAQAAFMSGKLKIKGNMGLAVKLGPIIDDARPKMAKL